MTTSTTARASGALRASSEQVLLLASLFWALAANRAFLTAALRGREWTDPATWAFALALGVVLLSAHFLLLGLVANRWTLKPVLALLIVATALADHFMQRYGVFLDPSMLRNVLRSDSAEARELLSWTLLAQLLLYAGLPLLLLWQVRIEHRPWPRAAMLRMVWLLLAGLLLGGTVLAVFQPFSALMRNQRELRYLVTPANLVWSLGRVLAVDAQGASVPRQAIGLDAVVGPLASTKPRLVVLVVGETARAANWGLNGYHRQTTPQLAQLPVINFSQATACGTNTEVSLPCMFAPVGRRDYHEERIRNSESLLHVLARAGVGVHWRDNQSGCKGVCDGLSNDRVTPANAPGLCADGHCLDEGLLLGLDSRLARLQGAELLVLHQMGNHGPGYARRYPSAFERFQPACKEDDLSRCTIPEIVNAYDNALLYTDHVLARLIGKLQALAPRVDTALIYVSDHGESLGENNLFLHGMPYLIAPEVQKKVPMVIWLSEGMSRRAAPKANSTEARSAEGSPASQRDGVDPACLRRRALLPVAHDHLFHTLLAMFDVRTALREPTLDLWSPCRTAAAP